MAREHRQNASQCINVNHKRIFIFNVTPTYTRERKSFDCAHSGPISYRDYLYIPGICKS